MEYPNGLELVKRLEDNPAYLAECARLLSAYVLMLHDPDTDVIGQTPAQETMTDKFKSQPNLKQMLELTERILGRPVPADTLEEIKTQALQQIPETNEDA